MKNIIIVFIAISNISIAQQTCRTEVEIPSSTPDNRFIDNADGTITDISTRLMWQKCQLGKSSNLCDIGQTSLFNWQEAIIEATNNNIGNYLDWRLPNISELESIVEQRCYDPAINTSVFPNTDEEYFWSSTPTSSSLSNVWGVYFDSGETEGYGSHKSRNEDRAIRLVRNYAAESILNVLINQASTQTDPTYTDFITYEVIFSSTIDPTTFQILDITLVGTSGTVKSIPTTSDNITWSFRVSGMTVGDVVVASIHLGLIMDTTGNLNNSSTSTDNQVTYLLPQSAPLNLNDTGITWGGNYTSGNNTTCTSNITPLQDCHQGRDLTYNDDIDGHAGFSFTKLDASGNILSVSAPSWSCVKDNVTGLVWEVKTNDGGIHDKDNPYRWGGITHQGDFGTEFYNDWDSLVNGSNGENLCGLNDWRVPTSQELISIVDYGRSNPAVDTNYFPNTKSSFFWSAMAQANNSGKARSVDFYSGNLYDIKGRFSNSSVRLVSFGQ